MFSFRSLAIINRETNRIRICSTNDGKMFASFHAKPNVEQREMQNSQPGLARFRSFYHFIDELIPMQSEDMKTILKFANGGYEPGLTILGFKPQGSIPFFHSIHIPLIIYPNDKEVQGSRVAFARLHAAMVRKKMLAIGEVQHRGYWQSRLVAVYPLEKSSDEEDSGKPAGMLVTKLPFEDDFRTIAPDEASKEAERLKASLIHSVDDNKVQSNTEVPNQFASEEVTEDDQLTLGNVASEELVAAAVKMITRLTVNKSSDLVDVPNDAMEEFFSYLKSVAFDLPRETIDRGGKIDSSRLPSKAKNAIEKFISLLPNDLPPQKKPSTGRKRVKDLPPDSTGIDWKTLYETDKLDSCKNVELKACLRSYGEYDSWCFVRSSICLKYLNLLLIPAQERSYQERKESWLIDSRIR